MECPLVPDTVIQMTSLIAWLDASSDDQRRMREIVRLFSQPESRDELGIGQIRDALADALFPGTSTLLTRARYLLFVPWAFRVAAGRTADGAALAAASDKAERQLIGGLRVAGNSGADIAGMLGASAGEALKTLPSSVYWAALGRYGILAEPSMNQTDALAAELERRRHRAASSDSIDEPTSWHLGAWSATLPPVPEGFPADVPGGLALTPDEAAWLKERIEQGAEGTVLDHVLGRRLSASSAPWLDPATADLEGRSQGLLEHAKRFSDAMYGSALLYNTLLAEAYEAQGFDRSSAEAAKHRPALEAWAGDSAIQGRLQAWDLDEFWSVLLPLNARIAAPTRRFVDEWVAIVQGQDAAAIAESKAARVFIANRERQHKRAQARLDNRRLLENWSGASGSGRLTFRWSTVRTIVTDIHDALEGAHA